MTIQAGSSASVNHHRNFNTPTSNQISALQRYAEDTSIPAPVRFGIHHYLASGQMTYAEASETIGMVKTFENGNAPRNPVDEPGLYVDPKTGAFYLVKKSQIGRFYAMDLLINDLGEKNPDGTWKVRPRFEWVYQNGHNTARKISADWKATPEQVKQWGDIFGHCIKCHAELTRQDSIDRGMGKTCFEKQFGK